MKLFVIFFLSVQVTCFAQKSIMLPNGWSLSPAGKSLSLGDLPLNMAVSRNGHYMAVTNNGQSSHSLELIDIKKQIITDSVHIDCAWYGLAFTADNKALWASGGNDNILWKYLIANGKLILNDSIILGKRWPEKISPAGIAIDDKHNYIYTVTKENNSLYKIDLATKKTSRFPLGGEGYACLLNLNNNDLYISVWGSDKILVFDTRNNIFTDTIAVGDNPNEICMSKNKKFLYVANANDNSVSVINLSLKKVIETLNAALYPDAPSGSTTNGLAISSNGKNLYIANADNNCLAVFDISEPGNSRSKGFIPTGWYPTNVKVLSGKILVSNGKGFSSLPNPNGPNPFRKKQAVIYHQGDTQKLKTVEYIGSLFRGTMSIINEPSKQNLEGYSAQVYANTPYTKQKELFVAGEAGNPIPQQVGDSSPIKYVFYIIKENRTYDQVLGDVKNGNGDTSLCLFGEKYTPNQHKLAADYVLMDNFYVDAEVSADGHNWSMGAYSTDYLEKTWPTYYGGRGGKYDAEGNREIANNKAGFIWDHAKKYNVSYRTYGEFADNFKPNIPALKNHYCNYFQDFDMSVRDTIRFNQWQRDFDSLVNVNQLPQLNTVRFGNDHTEGIRKGRPTPYAHVADNDLAVGLFIDHLSKSRVWKESVVFILEDDAQNGPDHVDAHRSPCYVVGPYVKRNFTDHTMYSTSSVLRTIELILGMPPMTQYDAAATPLWRSFTKNPDVLSYSLLPSNVNFNDKNGLQNELTILSEKYNWSKEDAVPDVVFNDLLWRGLKGLNYKVPAPKRAAFVNISDIKKEKD